MEICSNSKAKGQKKTDGNEWAHRDQLALYTQKGRTFNERTVIETDSAIDNIMNNTIERTQQKVLLLDGY